MRWSLPFHRQRLDFIEQWDDGFHDIPAHPVMQTALDSVI
jgi:hypothetical protein